MHANRLRMILLTLLVYTTARGNCEADHPARTSPVAVKLHRTFVPRNALVKVADVATVTGGDFFTRRKISELDLTLLTDIRKAARIPSEQVELRIQLEGIPQSDFRVTGASVVRLDGSSTINESGLLTLLRDRMSTRTKLSPEDIQLRLVSPMSRELQEMMVAETDLDFMLPQQVLPGTHTVRVGTRKNGKLTRVFSLSVEVQLTKPVLVARSTIENGSTIKATDVTTERRPLDRQQLQNLARDAIGRKVRRTIAEGSIISSLDLARPTPKRRDVVIKNRDFVDIVARRKSLVVRVSGAMALQSGARGESIRVRNPSSGKVLTARVVSPGIVELRL